MPALRSGYNPVIAGIFAPPVETKAAILIGKKADLAVVAALDEVEVKWDIRQREAARGIG